MGLRFTRPLTDDQWRAVLLHFLAVADSWAVNMPVGDGPLSNGRTTFASLPDVRSGPWSGMQDAVTYTGPLTAEARAAFSSTELSLVDHDDERKLWDYQLLVGDRVVLYIGDFSDLGFDEPDADVLRRIGIGEADFLPDEGQ